MKNRNESELYSGIVTIVLSIAALILFGMSYTTNYYTFGQMESGLIALLLGAALAVEIAALILRAKFADAFWSKFITFAVTGLLAAAAVLLLGDRVEGIGNCIITDYDSGHGGEEAIYMSIASSALMLAAMFYNIIGSFLKEKPADAAPLSKGARMGRIGGFGATGIAVLLAALIPTVNLVQGGAGAVSGSGVDGSGSGANAGSYKISFNQGTSDAESIPDYQFLFGNLGSLVKYDARFYLDITLALDGGSYTIFADAYIMEGGKRTEVGDSTGIGMVMKTTAEGTYTENEDGTVTTAKASHAVYELKTDTYSAQMKDMANLDIGGSSDDGTYDSDEYPEVLDIVPETVWTLGGDGSIQSYRKASAGDSYTISFNQNNGNVEDMPDYQFLCGEIGMLAKHEARLFVDVTLTLDGSGSYTLFSDAYILEGGKRAEVGDPTGIGMVMMTTAEGTYTENEDGTVTTSKASHASFEMKTDTYSAQMKDTSNISIDGKNDDGVYDSAEYESVLDFVPETVWTLEDGAIVTYQRADEEADDFGKDDKKDGESGSSGEKPDGEALAVASDDGATAMTFYADGTYCFQFESYGVEDKGTYAYDGKTLTVTDANGGETTAEGDPLKLHYAYSQSDQLTGDFTISASDLKAVSDGRKDGKGKGKKSKSKSESGKKPGAPDLAVTSDDDATLMTFYADGTYCFQFESYGVEDKGTYAYDGKTLTVTDANGKDTTAEGDPVKLHYAYSQSDQLTGDFTISASDLKVVSDGGKDGKGKGKKSKSKSESGKKPGAPDLAVTSDDDATLMTFYADGTYCFQFESYGVEDKGTYAYDGKTLTVTDANGGETTAEGDPLKLHYAYSQSDQLTGDFTISASELPQA